MNFIKLELGGPVARVTLDNTAGNRINFAMREELLEAFKTLAKSGARAAVLSGAGPDFCRGGDIREWPGMPVAELCPRVRVYADALEVLEQLPIPTIAAVQGMCMGGGFELALSCDFIVASRSARFAFPEAQLGILTLQAGVMRLAQRIGRAKALELVLLSTPIDAAQMATWNVVNRVVDEVVLHAEVDALAARLASGAPRVCGATKALLRRWTLEGYESAKAAWYDVSMPLFDTADAQAALRLAASAMDAGQPYAPPEFTGA